MSKENEFIRDKPKLKEGMAFSIFHKALPLFIAFMGFWIASQKLATMLNFDVGLCGYPWIVTETGYPIYFPFLILIMLVKHGIRYDLPIGDIIAQCTYLLLFICVVALALYFFLSWTRSRLGKDEPIYGTSRWAKAKDLKALGLLESCGVVLGQLFNANILYRILKGAVNLKTKKEAPIIQHSGETSTILFAPSRSGKGVSTVIPTLLSYSHSVINFDPKGENYNITAGFRRLFSHVMRFAPVNRKETLRFNPMFEIEEKYAFRYANLIADILVTPANGNVGDQQHWIDTARDLSTGAILHCLCSDYPEKTLHGVLVFLSGAVGAKTADGGETLLKSMINADHGNPEIHQIVCDVAMRQLSREGPERSSVFSTAVTSLQIFEDPDVAYATSDSDFRLSDFVATDTPISLYLTVPYSDLKRLSALMRLLITFILTKFSSGETGFGEIKLKEPILFIIDEFATLGTFQIIEEMMGILNAYGIRFLLICQSYEQIIKLYGDHSSILEHCRIMAAYANSDLKTAEMFSKMIGVESVVVSNDSSSGSRYDMSMNNVNISNQAIQRNLMNTDEFQHLPPNQLIVFSQGNPAYIAKKIVYYDDSRFKTKQKLPYPKGRAELLAEVKEFRDKDFSNQWFMKVLETSCIPSGDPIITEPCLVETIKNDKELRRIASRGDAIV